MAANIQSNFKPKNFPNGLDKETEVEWRAIGNEPEMCVFIEFCEGVPHLGFVRQHDNSQCPVEIDDLYPVKAPSLISTENKTQLASSEATPEKEKANIPTKVNFEVDLCFLDSENYGPYSLEIPIYNKEGKPHKKLEEDNFIYNQIKVAIGKHLSEEPNGFPMSKRDVYYNLKFRGDNTTNEALLKRNGERLSFRI